MLTTSLSNSWAAGLRDKGNAEPPIKWVELEDKTCLSEWAELQRTAAATFRGIYSAETVHQCGKP